MHDGVDTPTHLGFFGHLVTIHHVEFQILVDDGLLSAAGHHVPHIVWPVGAVEQEGSAGGCQSQHIVPLQEVELVHADKAGAFNQIRGMNWLLTEAKVRNRHGTRFLGIVDEVSLGVIRGIFTDDFDGVLVSPNSTVRTEAVKNGANHVITFNTK